MRFVPPAIAVLAIAIPALALVACGRTPEPVRETLWVFGSQARIELRGVDGDRAGPALAEVSGRLALRHRQWHAWQDSDLTRINAALARGESARAPDSILSALDRAAPLVTESGGLFDPAIGGLIALWGFHRSEFPIVDPRPTDATVSAWLARRPRLTDLRRQGPILSSVNPAMQLDLAAIAEGLAATEIAGILTEHGIAHALIEIGGDILALGDADGRPWRVALRDPFGDSPEAVLGSVELSDHEALFSSGGYQRYGVDPDGGRWPHILDPRTGHPAMASAAAVVLHPDPVRADAAATALFVAGPAGFAAVTESMALGCALLLDAEDRLYITQAMWRRLELRRVPGLRPALPRGADCAFGAG